MITVSILDWQYIYGQDLSERDAVVFQISEEDFLKIQSWKYELKGRELVEIEVEEVPEEEEIISDQKKMEMILVEYPLQRQLLIIMKALSVASVDPALNEMKDYIDGILAEEDPQSEE